MSKTINNNQSFQSQWQASWIRVAGEGTESPLLRCSLAIDFPVKQAILRATALGICELRLNGSKVGDTHLLPGWTDYRKRVYYHSFSVTEQLLAGENVLGAILGDGWFAGYFGPFGDKGYYGHDAWFSAVLEVEGADGSVRYWSTDTSWKGMAGPIVSADLLMGETYDARREIPAWDCPGFDSTNWLPVALITREERLPERVEAYPGTPVRTHSERSALSVTQPVPGRHVFDLGQNMVGVVRLQVTAPRGSTIIIRHGEALSADGTVYRANLRSARAEDRYISKGEGVEIWSPRFTFHGFRYVEVEGLPACTQADPATITGIVWASDLTETLSFECSNTKINRLFENIRWSFRGNYLEVPSDCPQRDERLGWTGDTQIFMRSATYLADVRTFHKKWLVDLHDAQAEDGGYPDYAPYLGRKNFATAGWADAGIICPYLLWFTYGDADAMQRWWPAMTKFMDLICADENPHNGPAAISYGDWLSFDDGTPVRLIGLAYRAQNARMMAAMAGAMGKTADQKRFDSEWTKSRKLFNELFFAGTDLACRTQTACALAIVFDLVSGESLSRTAKCLIEYLKASDGYLTTGFIGTAYLLPALTKIGRDDLAVQVLCNEKCPSWLYEVNQGATTIWERWNSWTQEHGFGDVGMNSLNHYAFGAVCEWIVESLAGIKPASPGFETVVIAPILSDQFDSIKATYDSVRGPISVHCERKETSNNWLCQITTPVPGTLKLPGIEREITPGHHAFELTNGLAKAGQAEAGK